MTAAALSPRMAEVAARFRVLCVEGEMSARQAAAETGYSPETVRRYLRLAGVLLLRERGAAGRMLRRMPSVVEPHVEAVLAENRAGRPLAAACRARGFEAATLRQWLRRRGRGVGDGRSGGAAA